MPRVLVSCRQLQVHLNDFRDLFEENDITVDTPDVVQQMSEDELVATIGQYDGIIAGDDPLTARVFAAGSRLRAVVKWGVGIDNIDFVAAEEHGVPVRNTPGTFGDEVADVVIGYLVLLARELHRVDALVRSGEWPKIQGRSVAALSLGIVGLGSIGMAVARRGVTMGMTVLGSDPSEERCAEAQSIGVRTLSLDDLFQAADVISLNCPLTRATRHLVNDRVLALMKPGSYLINTGRGPLVDEAALVRSLNAGRLRGAALDVFEAEPLPADSALRSFDNVIFGAHNASNTLDAVKRVNELAVHHLVEMLAVAPR